MKQKKLLLFILCIVSAALVSAQSIERSAIASAGNFYNVSGVQLSWTAGQASLVSTFTNSTATLTQGFQQEDLNVSINEEIPESFKLNVFPNPSSDVFNFDLAAFNDGAILLQLFDLNGRLIMNEGPFYTFSGSWNHQIFLSHLPVGLYQCRFVFKSNKGETSVKNIKLSVIK